MFFFSSSSSRPDVNLNYVSRLTCRCRKNMFQVRALVSEASALSTVLHCLALHSTSRGITDSAVAVAGALLAAAHEGGWESAGSKTHDEVGAHEKKTSRYIPRFLCSYVYLLCFYDTFGSTHLKVMVNTSSEEEEEEAT